MGTNITESYQYLAEQAKLNFQTNLSCLLEISQRIDVGLKDELLKIIINLGTSYDQIDSTNRLLHINFKAIEVLYQERKTHSLKSKIQAFATGKITKEDLEQSIQSFANTTKNAA